MGIVVTGSAGMLGSTLLRRLRETGRPTLGVDLNPAEGAAADIRDTARMTELLAGADAVVHCASALPSYPDDEIHSVIVEGTRSVLTAARDAGVPRVVHISSTAVYGLPKLVPTPEDHPREPVDPYSRAKAAAEEVAEKFRADGLCVPIIRPKTFLGPGRMGLFAMLFEWAEEGHGFPVLGRGGARIQMLAIDDLVDAILLVLDAPDDLANDTYNIAAAEFATLREDFQAVLDAAGHGRRVRSVPAGPALALLRMLGRTGLSPVYDRLLYKLLDDSYVAIGKARDRLGFAPRHSNRDAILGAYAWWRENAQAKTAGRTSRDAWRQGALSLVKFLF
ncbi:NAD-dependent epimerase/dehydratase family protein [Herbidospora sp. NEAU-GS84]|uniref:NAD-dependent epimerase/dehydratase family protein n=1 Tax=Herbidospora solisilvae TaxID=2696284 RepID=A0A7C9MUZ1_9ACTN|nr:NAD-dependent epimerase/dehydratase family protein [Herbidospora solisilvae]NAS20951.1 NAD-dependent epimerase/dehydratase family protein [Herbidospora solisilvae]